VQQGSGKFEITQRFPKDGYTGVQCYYMTNGGLLTRFYNWARPAMKNDTFFTKQVPLMDLFWFADEIFGGFSLLRSNLKIVIGDKSRNDDSDFIWMIIIIIIIPTSRWIFAIC
jgi:hypothetical protein